MGAVQEKAKANLNEAKGELKQMVLEQQRELDTWQKSVLQEAGRQKINQKEKQLTTAVQSKVVLKGVKQIVQSVLNPKSASYELVANAILKTVDVLLGSASAQSKRTSGYYLTSSGMGITRIHYYFSCQMFEGKYLLSQESQIMISYGYAVSQFTESINKMRLGSIIEGMNLDKNQKKAIFDQLKQYCS